MLAGDDDGEATSASLVGKSSSELFVGKADINFVGIAAETISVGMDVLDSLEETVVNGSTDIAIEVVLVGVGVPDSGEDIVEDGLAEKFSEMMSVRTDT